MATHFERILPFLTVIVSSTILISSGAANAVNLVINGGFADTSESGLGAFKSDYNFDGVRGDTLWDFTTNDRNPGEYIISSNPMGNVPQAWPELSSFDEGNENMLVADSFSSGSENNVLWGQDIIVEAGTTYTLSFAAAQLFRTSVILEALIDGTPVISETELSERGEWEVLQSTWIAPSSGTVSLEIFQKSNIHLGTDVALDAITLMPTTESVPEPSSFIGLVTLGVMFFKKRVR